MADTVHRVARAPDAFALPAWEHAGPDGTFGNRFDDPEGEYRVLYASLGRFGALCETLASLRPSLEVRSAVEALALGGEPVPQPEASLPTQWRDGRVAGAATLDARLANLGDSSTIAWLRDTLGTTVNRLGLADFDAATLRLSAPRYVTQLVGRALFEQADRDGSPMFAGLAYRSRYGDDITNVALFERPGGDLPLSDFANAPIEADDPDLVRVAELFGLELT